MRLFDFYIGMEFWFNGGRWRVTDIGHRVVIAIRVDSVTMGWKDSEGRYRTREITGEEAKRIGSFDGPPYRVVERVFDEDDRKTCTLTKKERP